MIAIGIICILLLGFIGYTLDTHAVTISKQIDEANETLKTIRNNLDREK